jgi:tetratricopeptide (TPR) repeat protein
MLGHLNKSIDLQKKAIALDPLQVGIYVVLGDELFNAGRYEEATVVLRKAMELNPQHAYTHNGLGGVLLAQGHFQEALAEMQQEPDEMARLQGEALAYHALGRQRDSDAALRELISRYAGGAAYQVAQVYAYRGEIDKALDWLERAYQQHDSGLADLKVDALLNSARQNPRYTRLLKKTHLPL